jgi:hypothetical protein
MADSTTTGSAIIGGCITGMAKELRGYAGSAYFCETIDAVYGDPNDVVTAQVGSQVLFDAENLDFYMAVAANGSTWNRLGSMA